MRHGFLYPLPTELGIVMLWGMYRGWPHPVIADVTMASVSTVKRLIRTSVEGPGQILIYPTLHKGLRWATPLWIHQICGEELK